MAPVKDFQALKSGRFADEEHFLKMIQTQLKLNQILKDAEE